MFGRIVGETPGVKAISAIGRMMPDWARPAASALEARGGKLDDIFSGQQPGDAVTRAQVARLLQAVFDLADGDASQFPDINLATLAEQAAIGAVNAAAIMTGEGDGRFNVHGLLNRAAMAKVLIKAQEQVSAE